MKREEDELFYSVFNEFEKDLFAELEDVINSDTAFLDILMYYEEHCLRADIIQLFLNELNLTCKLGESWFNNKNKVINFKRRNHNIILVLELILRKNKDKVHVSKLKFNQCTFNKNRKIIDNKIEKILDYYDLFITKNALYSERYDLKINSSNIFEFKNKDYNYKYNLQGYFESKVFGRELNDTIENNWGIDNNNSSKDIIYNIYKGLIGNMQSLNLDDNLGEYTVRDFLSLWSCVEFISIITIYNKMQSCYCRLFKYIEDKSYNNYGIKQFFDESWNFIENMIISSNNNENLMVYSSEIDLINFTKIYFDVEENKISKIIQDLIYKDRKYNFSISEYPFLGVEAGIVFSSYYIINEINIEFLIKKKSKTLYKEHYDKLHTEDIEPRICNKIKSKLEKNKDFIVKVLNDTISDEDGIEQSQIDVLVFDKIKKDIMIIEVKDHVEKIDVIDVVNQVRFESNIKRKGNAIKQLKIQNRLIAMNSNLKKYIDDIDIKDINNIYLGYCETHYGGTPRFIEELRSEKIAFIPYALLMKETFFKSVESMFKYFYNVKFIDKSKFKNSNATISQHGYKFIIPTFEHTQ